jgi:hypothetical protein
MRHPSANRVTARVKILELPERAQQLIGEGVIHLVAVDQLRELTDPAHGANLDLGHALIHNLTSLDPTDSASQGSSSYAEVGMLRIPVDRR